MDIEQRKFRFVLSALKPETFEVISLAGSEKLVITDTALEHHVSERGSGCVYIYGDHFRTPEEGDNLNHADLSQCALQQGHLQQATARGKRFEKTDLTQADHVGY